MATTLVSKTIGAANKSTGLVLVFEKDDQFTVTGFAGVPITVQRQK